MEEAGRATVAAGSAFEALGRILGGSVISPIEGHPAVFGGAVGYLSYDLVRSFESLPSLATDDVGLPTCIWPVSTWSRRSTTSQTNCT